MMIGRLLQCAPQIYKSVQFLNKLRPTRLFLRKCTSDSKVNIPTNVVKDVIMFKYDNPRFFKLLNVFAVCQFGIWGYLSYFTFTELRNVPVMKSRKSELTWWRRINLGEDRYRYLISSLAFIIGYGILTISWMYTLRSVRYLVLRKGGTQVTFVTYTPFGHNRMITLGLDKVSCKEMRTVAKSLLPIKVKDHSFYYVLDMRGEFKNAALFDNTAGLKRTFKS